MDSTKVITRTKETTPTSRMEDVSSFGSMLVDLFLSIILWLVQNVVTQLERYSRFILYQYHRVISLRRSHYCEALHHLKNIPTNVAIGINEPDLDYDRLLQLIEWCRLVPTIKTVTIYYPNAPEEAPRQLDLNLKDSQDFQVCFLTAQSGRQSLIEAARYFARDPTKEVTVDRISEYLKHDYPHPDPELLLIFGECQIYNGFPCWQIRLTETMFFAPLEWITLSQFYQALKVYSKCEQRFGK